jgi:hypothetical protein
MLDAAAILTYLQLAEDICDSHNLPRRVRRRRKAPVLRFQAMMESTGMSLSVSKRRLPESTGEEPYAEE